LDTKFTTTALIQVIDALSANVLNLLWHSLQEPQSEFVTLPRLYRPANAIFLTEDIK
jgi:hypothetical protein